MSGLEVKTERGNLDGEPHREVVRVFFREPGARRWDKFITVPGDGQMLDGIETTASEITAKYAASKDAP